MLRFQSSTGALVFSALLLSFACSSESSDGGSSRGGTDQTDQGGKTGAAGSRAGTSSQGGRAGRPATDSAGEGGEGGEGAQGGEGGAPEHCPGCASGLCLDDGTCVACLPKEDHCPSGQYCTDQYECAAGCKDDASCASGVCGADHNCKHCIQDSECASGYVCSAGECQPACSAENEGQSTGCEGGQVCCSQRCSDLRVDSRNCGACGNACDSGQFCGLTACAGAGADSCVTCHDTALASVCSVAKVTVILDSTKNTSDGNRVPGRAIGAALRDICVPKPVLSEAEQDSVEALNITTGRPVSDSSELLVVAGGPFFQSVEGYLEAQKIAPLYWVAKSDVTEYRKTATNELVVSLPIAGDHDSHDFFIIQFMHDPASGSLILNEQGFWLSGTVAGAYQLMHGLLPDLNQQDKAWYAYEWTDLDGDKAPDLDEIQLLSSGH